MTLFLHHLPELVKQGKIYAAMPPLYKTVNGKEVKYWYAIDESEYRKYMRNHKNARAIRYKGLGEQNADELYETTMNAENRHLVQLTTDDIEGTLKLYNDLMGKQPSLRRDFIMKNKLSSIKEDGDIFDDDAEDFE